MSRILLLLSLSLATSSLCQRLTTDLLASPIPPEALELAASGRVQIQTGRQDIDGAKVFYRRAKPGTAVSPQGKTLFLLHGAIYSSNTWVSTLPTIQTMAAAGFDVVAVDLPGFAQSRTERIRGDQVTFMKKLVSSLSPSKPVIVSPSMSGTFAIPLLVESPESLCGYVPVAPSIPGKYRSRRKFPSVPTMVVVGERDGFGSSEFLRNVIPTSSELQIIPNGEHAAYKTDPQRWHRLLYNFLNSLNCD